MGQGLGKHTGGTRAPSAAALTGSPIHPQVSCASLDAVVNYFVLHTKRALVPFLLDEDYEKVLGGRGFGGPPGPSPCLYHLRPTGTPLGQRLAAAPPPGSPLCSRLRGGR